MSSLFNTAIRDNNYSDFYDHMLVFPILKHI